MFFYFYKKLFCQIMNIMSNIEKNSKSTVNLVPMEGTHHFHMLKPEETAKIIRNFLDENVNKNLLFKIYLKLKLYSFHLIFKMKKVQNC